MSVWLRAFALTVLIELPIVFALTAGSRPRRILVIVLAQLATHPLLWFFFARLPGVTGTTGILLGELFAVVCEAVLYRVALPIPTARAVAASALANGTSLALGLLLFR